MANSHGVRGDPYLYVPLIIGAGLTGSAVFSTVVLKTLMAYEGGWFYFSVYPEG